MRVLPYNIQYGLGSGNRYDLSRSAKVVNSADIAALQEVTAIGPAAALTTSPQFLLNCCRVTIRALTWTPQCPPNCPGDVSLAR